MQLLLSMISCLQKEKRNTGVSMSVNLSSVYNLLRQASYFDVGLTTGKEDVNFLTDIFTDS